jgi:hypothetical protein
MATLFVYKSIAEPDIRRSLEWERMTFSGLSLLSLYAALIYGNVLQKFGGGKPIPVVIYFAGKETPLGENPISAFLVDQTADGYYLLREGGKTTKVYFLRSDIVSVVEFTPGLPNK